MKNLQTKSQAYTLQIMEDGVYGWNAIVIDSNNDIILDSSHYGAFTSNKEKKEILAQFRQELGIKKFSSIS